jgi:DNA-directed RNA polymerase alpha subunit
MTREDRLDALAMEAMKASIVNGGIVNTYALALNAYVLASEMLKRRQLVLEQILLGDKPSMLLDEVPFTVRTSNCLREANIFNVGQLQQWTEYELLKLPNLGRKSLKEIIDELGLLGLQLRDPQARV